MNLPILVFAAYLIGSLSFAVIVSKLMGLADPRTYGSNNPGATNVLRSGNKKAAALTLLGDAFKGWLAVFLAQLAAPRLGLGDQAIALCALATTLGHMWPIFFSFKGGKGVATALGILLALNAWMGLGLLAVWLFMAKVVKISSLSALIAALCAPIFAWFLLPGRNYFLAVCVIALLLIVRHKKNIMGLLQGKEGRIGQAGESQKTK
ncbi:MAG: glycerol-3-phosphate 1-O-acyltransferase PlsY [Formivibrio sp.]|nr:glycerol-3-phosphate 1-O-acyltransferase PlsY [Formivibrio sp.]